jgi:hypothetical protein
VSDDDNSSTDPGTAAPVGRGGGGRVGPVAQDDAALVDTERDNNNGGMHGTAGQKEIGGRAGPDPTRFGDWEIKGRCIDF